MWRLCHLKSILFFTKQCTIAMQKNPLRLIIYMFYRMTPPNVNETESSSKGPVTHWIV